MEEQLISKTARLIPVQDIVKARMRLKGSVLHTPLQPNLNLSNRYHANILLKREDLQVVRSYKIRGAMNKMVSLAKSQHAKGVVCASAGNHAQGVAFACYKLKIKGTIFMPTPTPKQKVNQVGMFGKDMVEIRLVGDTFDDAYREAKVFSDEQGATFIPPFDDEKVMEGQGTVALEILEDAEDPIDYLIVPIGGGGLICGLGSYFRQISPSTKIIGVEPAGAPAMKKSLEMGERVLLDKIDKFVDGAAVKQVGVKNFDIAQKVIDEVITVPEGKVCTTILRLYNEDAIVVEPAGALSIAALDQLKDVIKGKNVTCIVSGSNNDITRMEEIKERSLLFEGLKHYFIIKFPQRAGALRDFLVNALGPNDDIVHFEYTKKTNREKGPAMVGIEVQRPEDFQLLKSRLDDLGFGYEWLNDNMDFYGFLL